MTIGRGGAWGHPAPARPAGAGVPRAAGDAELARWAMSAHDRGERLVAEVGPGDVLRTLGLDAPRPAGEQLVYPFDLGLASLDGGPPRPFVAHAVARRPLWRGEAAVAMNAAWLGSWYLGPRAHPNDGLLDVTWGTLPLGQRLLARRRAATGSHLPHPALTMQRRERWIHEFTQTTPVRLDGEPAGTCRILALWLVPDCFELLA